MLAFAHCGQLLLLMRREPAVVAQNDHHVELGVGGSRIADRTHHRLRALAVLAQEQDD